jgi:hypothetical protein
MKYLIDNNSNYTLLTLLPPNIPASICTGVYRGENGFGLTGVLFRASVYEMFISTVFVPDFFSFDEHLTIFGRGHLK